jgi:ceramide glucosyltransferase
MTQLVATGFIAAAALSLALIAVEVAVLRSHLSAPPPRPLAQPPISILKPLCGVDDGLRENLESFAALDHPAYEVLLGLRDASDPARALAAEAAERWPGRFRVVLQRGAPGVNPKVNQLVTLAAEAQHPILVVSDSNVRVQPSYLSEIAALLADPGVGLVTHLIAGVGERRAGSLLENLHFAGTIAPGIAAAKRLLGRDVVMGKSMAFRREDLAALGGFEAVKDVLAEDYVLGLMVPSRLGKRVALACRPVQNVSREKRVAGFVARCQRWSVLQRKLVGPWLYASQVVLNPVFLAAIALALAPGRAALAAFAVVAVAKALLDGRAARALRPGGFSAAQLLASPAKDLVFGAAWAAGFLEDTVDWRGTRLRVLAGTRIERAGGEPSAG